MLVLLSASHQNGSMVEKESAAIEFLLSEAGGHRITPSHQVLNRIQCSLIKRSDVGKFFFSFDIDDITKEDYGS